MKKLLLILLFSIPCFADSTVVDIYSIFFAESGKVHAFRTARDSSEISIAFYDLFDREIESDSLWVHHQQLVFWPELDSTVIYDFNWIVDSLAVDTLGEEWMNNAIYRALYNAKEAFYEN